MTVWRRWRCRNVSVGSPSVDPQKNPGGLDVSGVFLFPHHLRRVQETKVRTAARSPGILRRRRHLLLPGRGIGSLPRRCIDVGISFTIPIPEESLEVHDLPESGLRRECGESEPQCERHAVEPVPSAGNCKGPREALCRASSHQHGLYHQARAKGEGHARKRGARLPEPLQDEEHRG